MEQEGRIGAKNAPESQTLIVPEAPPDTICFPSGENCTELMRYGSALLSSVLRSSVAVREGRSGQFWLREGVERGNFAPESQTLMLLS